MSTERRDTAGAARGRLVTTVLVVVAGLGAVVAGTLMMLPQPEEAVRSPRPPSPEGYFETLPPGAWSTLPSDRACADRVRRSSWEPRPDNDRPNSRAPDAASVRSAFAARPRAVMGAYSPMWDRWLLPRVTGGFIGTTDEILQWAACKWGLADNVLRAVAVRESGWYQYQVYPDGGCVEKSGCGDWIVPDTAAARRYCRQVSAVLGPHTGGPAEERCPRTFSIVGVMSWHDPEWGRMPGNHNGTFPFNARSTAFAVDYLGSFLRGCLEGWVRWLGNTGSYRPGDLPGCLGAWFAGAWRTPDALRYAGLVAEEVSAKRWLAPRWHHQGPPCSPDRGCPRGGP